MIALLQGYQRYVSPLLPPGCRFEPSCSQYSIETLREYGLLKGALLTGWRLLRCNPLNGGGHDSVHSHSEGASARRDRFAAKTRVLGR